MIRCIITDIEGTTTDIDFVQQILFPYAQAHLAETVFLENQNQEIAAALNLLREEISQPDATAAQLLDILLQWVEQDKKSTSLKLLQGIIWRTGYQKGDFTGHLYDDVLPQLAVWHDGGIQLGVYSSGSVEAQQLLFRHSKFGDVTPFFQHWFDTRSGAKRSVSSYRLIAEQLNIPPDQILFLSDISQELDAAKEAGWQTCQLVRGNADFASCHSQVHRFDQINLQHYFDKERVSNDKSKNLPRT